MGAAPLLCQPGWGLTGGLLGWWPLPELRPGNRHVLKGRGTLLGEEGNPTAGEAGTTQLSVPLPRSLRSRSSYKSGRFSWQ